MNEKKGDKVDFRSLPPSLPPSLQPLAGSHTHSGLRGPRLALVRRPEAGSPCGSSGELLCAVAAASCQSPVCVTVSFHGGRESDSSSAVPAILGTKESAVLAPFPQPRPRRPRISNGADAHLFRSLASLCLSSPRSVCLSLSVFSLRRRRVCEPRPLFFRRLELASQPRLIEC